jgi:hypothetical protein
MPALINKKVIMKSKKFKSANLIFGVLTSITLIACGPKTDAHYSNAPSFSLECSQLAAAGCNQSNINKTMFIGIDVNTTTDCRAKLSQYTTNADRVAAFDYSSTTLTQNIGPSTLVGVTSIWVNSYAMPVAQLPAQSYKVCAFIDLDNNETLDLNEPIQDSIVDLTQSNFVLTNWSLF